MADQEQPRSSAFKIPVVLVLGFLLVFSIVLTFQFRTKLVSDPEDKIPILIFVFLAAILGSAVNESKRDTEFLLRLSSFDLVVFFCWKLLVAIVFALFLYVAFASGIVAGGLFPVFDGVKDVPYKHMMKFLVDCKPLTNQDVAKMFVWAFIAGYLEKFVPNLIQKIESEKTHGDAKN
jgi:hypothetical protein